MILLTGGTGYIGSHTLLELLNSNYKVVVLDNLSNSSKTAFDRVCAITNRADKAVFIQGDIRDSELLDTLFQEYDISAVMHFAGLKAVGESVSQPLSYFDNNISGTVTLLQAMQRANIRQFIFSSSATVYGDPVTLPLTEAMPTQIPTNPYGYSKLVIEQMTAQLAESWPELRVGILRYFNPIGAHISGQIGEDPQGIPNNLMPYLSQVAIGRLESLSVYGDDYPTMDGTGIRDYIHVIDLAIGHIKALEYLQTSSGYHIWNLGTGQGYSVLELINTFEQVTSVQIPYQIVARRSGDIAACYADVSKANRELGWRATRSLEEMITDTWRWQQQNPLGYRA